MKIGDRETALLAELKDMPSFVLLMAIFKEFEETVLGELAGQKETEGLVRITRFYQCLRAIREFLESRPESAYDELKRVNDTFFAGSANPQQMLEATRQQSYDLLGINPE